MNSTAEFIPDTGISSPYIFLTNFVGNMYCATGCKNLLTNGDADWLKAGLNLIKRL